jgi:2-dehydro-3-deoxyphosphogluconate aldolase/(4S)-4-hydroxy-2-oxoglutarate aldolase
MPGVATPSDIEVALESGCRDLKFFPAEPCGGLAYLKSMAAPYAHLGIRFVPLGGLSTGNLRDYLETPSVLAVGGSWLAPRPLIQGEAWQQIRSHAVEANAIVKQARAGQTKLKL